MTITAVPSSGGVSSETKIGIGVGVAVAVLLIAAAAFVAFLLQQRRKVKARAAGHLLNMDNNSGKSEFDGQHEGQLVPMQPMPVEVQAKGWPSQVQEAHELPSSTRFELNNERPMGELSTDGGLQQGGPRRISWERGR